MDKKLLPKHFFRDNHLARLSAPLIAYTSVTMDNDVKYQAEIQKKIDETLSPEQKALLEKENAAIAELETGEEVVKFIRRGVDILNCATLGRKIISMQEEVLPLLLRRFLTTSQECVIEATMYTLSDTNVEQTYIDQLVADYPKIRNPYTQCMACLVFGIQEREETLPLLLREYERLKREYPEESYCQGPLLAIYILFGEA